MQVYETSRRINADPPTVWRILTDPARLVAIGSGVTRLDGRIAPGERLKLQSEASPGRIFPLIVTAFDPPHFMEWVGGMPFGLFKGRRTFRLSSTNGATNLGVLEEYTGLMLQLIWKSMPDLQPSFEQFADAVKRAAEEEAR